MTDLTVTALVMIAGALVSTPPLFLACMRDVGRREAARAGRR